MGRQSLRFSVGAAGGMSRARGEWGVGNDSEKLKGQIAAFHFDGEVFEEFVQRQACVGVDAG